MSGSWLLWAAPTVLGAALAACTLVPDIGAWRGARQRMEVAVAPAAEVAREISAREAEAQSIEAEIAVLEAALAEPEPVPTGDFIVVGIQDRSLQLWEGGRATLRVGIAVGQGEKILDGEVYRFDTPRGSYSVRVKEEDPLWVAPDWHYLEVAAKKGAKPAPVTKSKPLTLKDGSRIEVQGDTLARCTGEVCTPYRMSEEIVVEGKVVVPPVGVIQRAYPGILGTHRLKLGEGYGIHGTDKPGSIGRAASHGCIRVRNADIAVLYDRVAVGTPVYIY